MGRATATGSWARHYQEPWRDHADDEDLPYWLRLASLAYGHHGDNGHAPFKRGELVELLTTYDPETGQVRRSVNLRREIARAIGFGFLAEGSFWGCLIVPPKKILKGKLDVKAAPCPHAERHNDRSNRTSGVRNGASSPTPSVRFKPETVRLVDGSQPEPLLSDLPTARQGRSTPNTKRTNRARKEAS